MEILKTIGEYIWFLMCYLGKSRLHKIVDNPLLSPEEIVKKINKTSTLHGHYATHCKSIKPKNPIYSEIIYESAYIIWRWPDFEKRTQQEKRKLKKKFST